MAVLALVTTFGATRLTGQSVGAAPAQWEVDEAVEILRRFVAAEEAERMREALEANERGEDSGPSAVALEGPIGPVERDQFSAPAPGPLAAPTLGTASLSLDGQLHLGADSAIFAYEGIAAYAQELFLWDDAAGNLGLGNDALSANTTGFFNIAVGSGAMLRNTEGSHNTAVGTAALLANTTGSHNTAVGRAALALYQNGSYNTAIGYYALLANSSGANNTAIGSQASIRTDTGSNNTAVGFRALRAGYANNTGLANTAAGAYALEDNTSGLVNTAIGVRALADNQTGLANTAVGVEALSSNTIGSSNTAVGDRALENATGHRNTAFGPSAGNGVTTGSDNILIGWLAYGEASDDDTIRIGDNTNLGGGQTRAFIAGIRGITTGNNNADAVLIDSEGQLGTTSSSRTLKDGIRPIGELSQRLLDLHPVAFRYRQHAASDPDGPLQFGLLAEDVAEIFPELVITDDNGRPTTVRYHLLAPLLVNELQRSVRLERELDQALIRQRRELALLRRQIAGSASLWAHDNDVDAPSAEEEETR